MKRTPATSAIGKGGEKNMLVGCVVKIKISATGEQKQKIDFIVFLLRKDSEYSIIHKNGVNSRFLNKMLPKQLQAFLWLFSLEWPHL